MTASLHRPLRQRLFVLGALLAGACALGAVMAWSRTPGLPAPPPWTASNCGNAVALRDLNQALLIEYRPESRTFHQHDVTQTGHFVVGQALLLCEVGGFAYLTQERESSSAHSRLHLRVAGQERSLLVKEGINTLQPLAPGQLLVQTTLIRRAPIDPALGDLPDDEDSRLLPGAQARAVLRGQKEPSEDPQPHLYLEDLVLGLPGLERIRSVRGTLMPHRWQGGRLITYSMDGGAYEFDPKTGRRQRLHLFRTAFVEGDGVNPMMQFGARYYVWRDRLYAANGHNMPFSPPGDYWPANTLYRFEGVRNRWTPVFDFGFTIQAQIMADEKLVLAGGNRIMVFDMESQQARMAQLDFKGLEPVAIASLDAGWLLALSEPDPPPGTPESGGVQLWLVGKDDLKVRQTHRLEQMDRVRLSTRHTPEPGWMW